MRLVNGYFCRNCADEALAKRGLDPAHPTEAVAGNEVFVSQADAARNRGPLSALAAAQKAAELGVNHPETSGDQGRKVNLYA